MRTFRLFVAFLSFAAVHTAEAQHAVPIGFTTHSAAAAAKPAHVAAALPGNSGTPRWVKWGLVGAIGGAVLFTLANSGNHSTGSDILAGAATGFVVVGGGVLIYDLICSSGSGSSGFCGR